MNPYFEVTDRSVINALLDSAEYGTLGLCVEEIPYAVPVNFVRIGEAIFFHGALANKKMKMLSRNPNVSFSVVEHFALIDSDFSSTEGLACPATQFFKSVSIRGRASVVEGREEKATVLEALMQKLQPKGGYRPFHENAYDKALKSTAVVRVDIGSLSCKFKFGQHLSDERFDMILKHLENRGNEIDLKTVKMMKMQRAG